MPKFIDKAAGFPIKARDALAGRAAPAVPLGPMTLYWISTDGPPAGFQFPRTLPGAVWIVVQMAGSLAVSQDEKSTTLRAGALTVLDASRHFDMIAGVPFSTFVVSLPEESLMLTPGRLRKAIAKTFAARTGLSAIVADHLATLWREAPEVTPDQASLLARTTITMIRAVIADGLTSDGVERPVDMWGRITEFIDDHISDPLLSLAFVAQSNNVSTRYLQKLFSTHGATITSWIRDRRLDLSRVDLDDPRMSSYSIAEIGGRWGMYDTAYYSRAFKARFGCAPSVYRGRRR